MVLLVSEFLVERSFNDLEREHGVCSRINSSADKVSLNYDMILTPSGDRVAAQCRGLIMRPESGRCFNRETWKDEPGGRLVVLARPMDRFYNDGDVNAADIDWSDCSVYEKLDGTMIVMYWDALHGTWHVGTRAVPEADLPFVLDHPVHGDVTFTQLFWRSFQETTGSNDADEFLRFFRKDVTYSFELTTPMNRVVVKYNDYRITLIAARETRTGNELRIEGLLPDVFPLPTMWKLNDPTAIAAFVNQADPSKLEGAVVVDSRFNRRKIKNKAWVLSSRAKDLVTVSRRAALEAIIMGTMDDVIPLLEKDIADELIKMQVAVGVYFKQLDANFATFKEYSYGSRKTFAEQVMLSNDWVPAYFNLWEGKATSSLEWTRKQLAAQKMTQGSLETILKKLKM